MMEPDGLLALHFDGSDLNGGIADRSDVKRSNGNSDIGRDGAFAGGCSLTGTPLLSPIMPCSVSSLTLEIVLLVASRSVALEFVVHGGLLWRQPW